MYTVQCTISVTCPSDKDSTFKDMFIILETQCTLYNVQLVLPAPVTRTAHLRICLLFLRLNVHCTMYN